MGIFKFYPPKNAVSRTLADKVLEGFACVLIASLWGLTVYFWKVLPDIIPFHLNLSGQPDSWGNKDLLFLITGLGTLVALAVGIGAYYPQRVNLPVKLRPECLSLQYAIISRMSRVCNVWLALIFIFSLVTTALGANGQSTKLWWGIQAVVIILLLGSILFYSLKIGHCGRQSGK